MENAIDQGKNVILGSFCVLVQPLPQHIIPCKYWTKLRFATSEQHLWLPRTYTGLEIKLLGVWQVFWKHPPTSPSLSSCPSKRERVHNGQEWQHSSLPYKELFFFNVWVLVCVCVCIFNRAAVSLCRSCHWWGEARAATEHFAEHGGSCPGALGEDKSHSVPQRLSILLVWCHVGLHGLKVSGGSGYPEKPWELLVSHTALESLELSRQFKLFEDIGVLLVGTSQLWLLGWCSEGWVDASTLPCHQQLPVPPSSVWLCC